MVVACERACPPRVETLGGPLQQEMLLASLSTWASPHEKFLKEVLETSSGDEKSQALDAQQWPALMHLKWLEVLLHTSVTAYPPKPSKDRTTLRLPQPTEVLQNLLTNLINATIVSMARSEGKELALAKEYLTHNIGNISPMLAKQIQTTLEQSHQSLFVNI